MIAVATALAAIMIAPVAFAPDPYLMDYLNHFARAYITANANDPDLARHYTVQWSLVPNLGWDGWMYVFGPWLGFETAGRLFIATCIAITVSGAIVLQRALTGRISITILLLLPFIFNDAYRTGFLSFLLGLGLSLWAMAAWVMLLKCHWAMRLVLALPIPLGLFLIHVHAFFVYAVGITAITLADGYATGRIRHGRYWAETLRDAVHAFPALCLIALWIAAADTTGELNWGPPWDKLAGILRLVGFGPLPLNIAALVIAAALAIWTCRALDARIDRRALWAVGLLFGAYLVMPQSVLGGHHGDWRLLIPIAWLLLAGTVPQAALDRGRTVAALAVLTLLLSGIAICQFVIWNDSAAARSEFRRLIADIPAGATIFFAHTDREVERHAARRMPGLYHVASDAAIAKHTLVSTQFAIPDQHILEFRNPILRRFRYGSYVVLPDVAQRIRDDGNDFADHVLMFDFLVLLGPPNGQETDLLPFERLHLVKASERFRLFEVAPAD